jgi:hypothetical protein
MRRNLQVHKLSEVGAFAELMEEAQTPRTVRKGSGARCLAAAGGRLTSGASGNDPAAVPGGRDRQGGLSERGYGWRPGGVTPSKIDAAAVTHLGACLQVRCSAIT